MSGPQGPAGTIIPVFNSKGGRTFTYCIPRGNYTAPQLAERMQEDLNELVKEETGIMMDIFEVKTDPVTNFFGIFTNKGYEFIWEFMVMEGTSRPLRVMLGYNRPKKVNYSDQFTNLVAEKDGEMVPFQPIVLNKGKYVWLRINLLNHIYDELTRRSYFAKITFEDTPHNDIAYNTFTPSTKIFDVAPLPEFFILEVNWVDEEGNPANFNNIDHSFTLEFYHYYDRAKGMDYDSRRGTHDWSSVYDHLRIKLDDW